MRAKKPVDYAFGLSSSTPSWEREPEKRDSPPRPRTPSPPPRKIRSQLPPRRSPSPFQRRSPTSRRGRKRVNYAFGLGSSTPSSEWEREPDKIESPPPQRRYPSASSDAFGFTPSSRGTPKSSPKRKSSPPPKKRSAPRRGKKCPVYEKIFKKREKLPPALQNMSIDEFHSKIVGIVSRLKDVWDDFLDQDIWEKVSMSNEYFETLIDLIETDEEDRLEPEDLPVLKHFLNMMERQPASAITFLWKDANDCKKNVGAREAFVKAIILFYNASSSKGKGEVSKAGDSKGASESKGASGSKEKSEVSGSKGDIQEKSESPQLELQDSSQAMVEIPVQRSVDVNFGGYYSKCVSVMKDLGFREFTIQEFERKKKEVPKNLHKILKICLARLDNVKQIETEKTTHPDKKTRKLGFWPKHMAEIDTILNKDLDNRVLSLAEKITGTTGAEQKQVMKQLEDLMERRRSPSLPPTTGLQPAQTKVSGEKKISKRERLMQMCREKEVTGYSKWKVKELEEKCGDKVPIPRSKLERLAKEIIEKMGDEIENYGGKRRVVDKIVKKLPHLELQKIIKDGTFVDYIKDAWSKVVEITLEVNDKTLKKIRVSAPDRNALEKIVKDLWKLQKMIGKTPYDVDDSIFEEGYGFVKPKNAYKRFMDGDEDYKWDWTLRVTGEDTKAFIDSDDILENENRMRDFLNHLSKDRKLELYMNVDYRKGGNVMEQTFDAGISAMVKYLTGYQKDQVSIASVSESKSESEPEIEELSISPAKGPTNKTGIACIDNSKTKLHDHQISVAEHLQKHRGLIVIHSVGAGKTLTAVAASQCVLQQDPNVKVLLVAGKSLKKNFSKEFAKYGIKFDPTRYELMTYEKFVNQMRNKEKPLNCSGKFLIVDEAHKLRTMIKGKEGQTANAVLKCAERAHRVLLLTATPFINAPQDILNLVAIVEGNRDLISSDKTDEKYMKKLLNNRKLFNDIFGCKVSMYQRDLNDPFFPEYTEEEIPIEMSDTFYKEYLKVQEKDLEGQKEGDEMGGFLSNVRQLGSLMEVRGGNPKLEWIKKLINDDPNKQRIIFSHFIEHGIAPLEEFLKERKIEYSVITGEVDDEDERQQAVRDYNAGRTKIMMLSMKAGGEGLDLKNTDEIILVEPGWNRAEAEQAMGRGIRFRSHPIANEEGERGHVQVYHLVLEKPEDLARGDNYPESIDEQMMRTAYEKDELLKKWLKKLSTVSIEKRGNKDLCNRMLADIEAEFDEEVIGFDEDEFEESDFDDEDDYE